MGANRLTCHYKGADGTKPAEVTHRPSWPTKAAKPPLVTEDLSAKGSSSAGGPKLLKWGLLGRGVKSAKVPPTPDVYSPRCTATGFFETGHELDLRKQQKPGKKVFAKVAKVRLPRARGQIC